MSKFMTTPEDVERIATDITSFAYSGFLTPSRSDLLKWAALLRQLQAALAREGHAYEDSLAREDEWASRCATNVATIAKLQARALAAEAALAARGEPVAWRVKDFADGWFFYGLDQMAEATRAELDGFRVEPLYALTAPPGVGEDVRKASQNIINRMFSTYRARNGRQVGVEADDGEKCWIVHSDDIEALRAALLASTPLEQEKNSSSSSEIAACSLARSTDQDSRASLDRRVEPAPKPGGIDFGNWSYNTTPERTGNPYWTPDLQDLIYTAINHVEGDYGDADDNCAEQVIERLVLAIKALLETDTPTPAMTGKEG